MWNYEKRLQYPVKITQTNPKIAQIILSQFGRGFETGGPIAIFASEII